VDYLPPYHIVRQLAGFVTIRNETFINTPYEDFRRIIKLFLRGVNVDEEWYRRTYPDIAQAICEGRYKSSKHHFVEEGYFEGRQPFELQVNEQWYLTAYEDVRDSIAKGDIPSAKAHFVSHGYMEGRLPIDY
jgi:hypothetical protein